MEATLDNEPSYRVSTLLGNRENRAAAFLARQLIEFTAQRSTRKLLLAVSTKVSEATHLRQIVEYVKGKLWPPETKKDKIAE